MIKKAFLLCLLLTGLVPVFSQDEGSRLLDILDTALNAAEGSIPSASPAPAQGGGENPAFNILNKTGFTIKAIFISAAGEDSGEKNVFNGNLYNGQSTRILLELPRSKANRYNIRLVDADGDRYSKHDVDISSPVVIVISISDFEF
jgi:hypothetical protein